MRETEFHPQSAYDESDLRTKPCAGRQRSRSQTGVRLLVRLDANSNPNRQDHLMRVAEANALSGITDLTIMLGVRYMALVSMSSTELNSLLMGTRLHAVASNAVQVRGPQVSRYGLSQFARICPQCVAEDIPQSQVFNSSLPVHCPIHKILPLDFCPGCGCSLSYLRRTVRRCNCGYQFATARSQRPPMWLQVLYGIFAPWHLTGFVEDEFRMIASEDYRAAELIQTLLGYKEVALQRRRITSKDFNELESFFDNWKEKFRLAITPYFETNSPAGNSKFLKRLSKHNEVLNKSVIAAGINFSPAQMSIKDSRKEPEKNEISASAVRKKAKLDAEAMRQYLLSVESVSVRNHVSGRKFQTINPSEIKDVEEYLDGTMSIQDSSTYLGYSVPDLRALAKVGLIKSQMLVVKPRSPRFLKDCLDAWLHILARASVKITKLDEKLVRLTDITAHKASGDVRTTWLRLMKMIQARQIVLSLLGPPSQASNFYVNSRDLAEIGFLKIYNMAPK